MPCVARLLVTLTFTAMYEGTWEVETAYSSTCRTLVGHTPYSETSTKKLRLRYVHTSIYAGKQKILKLVYKFVGRTLSEIRNPVCGQLCRFVSYSSTWYIQQLQSVYRSTVRHTGVRYCTQQYGTAAVYVWPCNSLAKARGGGKGNVAKCYLYYIVSSPPSSSSSMTPSPGTDHRSGVCVGHPNGKRP